MEKFKLQHALRVLRKFELRIWKSYLKQDFVSWFEIEGKDHEEWLEIDIAGKTALARTLKASWWEWDHGSSLFFWRWPVDYQNVAWKGVIPMFLCPPPQNKLTQPKYRNEEIKTTSK